MPVTDATKLPAVEPPRDPEARPGFSLGGFVPPGPTFKHWVEEAQYLASIPAELGMPRELIGQPKGVYMRMKMAEAMDIPLWVAIQDMYVIGEKIGTRAELIRTLMLRAGHQFWFPHHDERLCVMRLRRAREDAVYEVVWTWEQAEAAGLTTSPKTGDTWHQYPEDCLVAAATRRMGRRHAPDVTRGFGYGRDELVLAQSQVPFAASAAELAAQVAEVVAEAAQAQRVPELTRVCHDAEARALMNQVTDETGPGCGETLRVYLLQRWEQVKGDPAAAPRAQVPGGAAGPAQAARVRKGKPDTWLHPDCGTCKMMTVLTNGDHDPGCPHRVAPTSKEQQ
jgi:hypothetical protein